VEELIAPSPEAAAALADAAGSAGPGLAVPVLGGLDPLNAAESTDGGSANGTS
jgi:hypothetical protein